MICSNIKHLLNKYLVGQRILDINYNNLAEEFQKSNEYDSVDICLQNNSILRVQCTLRILYRDKIVFLSNNRFFFDTAELCEEDCYTFCAQLNKLSLANTNSTITNIAFTELGDLKFVTNTGFEYQIIIDTRRTDCTSYDLWDFDNSTILRVYCENGIILGGKEGEV